MVVIFCLKNKKDDFQKCQGECDFQRSVTIKYILGFIPPPLDSDKTKKYKQSEEEILVNPIYRSLYFIYLEGFNQLT